MLRTLWRWRHQLAHRWGWNYGTAEVWTDCGASFTGFRCQGCGQLQHVEMHRRFTPHSWIDVPAETQLTMQLDAMMWNGDFGIGGTFRHYRRALAYHLPHWLRSTPHYSGRVCVPLDDHAA